MVKNEVICKEDTVPLYWARKGLWLLAQLTVGWWEKDKNQGMMGSKASETEWLVSKPISMDYLHDEFGNISTSSVFSAFFE